MSEEKKKTKKKAKTQEEAIAEARKRRIALAKESTPVKEKSNDREDFRIFFIKINKKLKLRSYFEDVIWTHLKTIKHDKKDLFEKGIEHFGYRL